MSLRTSTPRLGTDGDRKLIPQTGDALASVEGVPKRVQSRETARWKLLAYSVGLGGLAVAIGAALALSGAAIGNPWVVIALCVAAVITDRASVRLSDTTDLTVSPVVTLFAAVLFGPLAGGLVGAASELGDGELFHRSTNNRSPRLKWLTYTSTRFISGALMGLTAQAILAQSALHGWIVPGDDRSVSSRRGVGDRFCRPHGLGSTQSHQRDSNRRSDDGDRGVCVRAGRCQPHVCI